MRCNTRVVQTAALIRDRLAGIVPSTAPVKRGAAECSQFSLLSGPRQARLPDTAVSPAFRLLHSSRVPFVTCNGVSEDSVE
jgi:hypothetical protein